MEDVHWIDEVSESMMADVLAVIGQTPAIAVVTYRPDYDGALSRVHGAQTIALTPLTDSETSSLIGELLGPDPSNEELAAPIASRVAEIRSSPRRWCASWLSAACSMVNAEITSAIPTLPMWTRARHRPGHHRGAHRPARPLGQAHVERGGGHRTAVRPELLTRLGVEPAVDELVRAELIDQVRFTPRAEYAFHHPLIRAVAYESQLKADRSEWHRRLAEVIEADEPESVDENAALIAEHLEAAGEARQAYGWHMRAGRWSTRARHLRGAGQLGTRPPDSRCVAR